MKGRSEKKRGNFLFAVLSAAACMFAAFFPFTSAIKKGDTCTEEEVYTGTLDDMRTDANKPEKGVGGFWSKILKNGIINGGETDKTPFKPQSKGYADEKKYTYTLSLAGTKSLNWNPHTWTDNTDSKILELVTIGFFDFVLASDGASYLAVPEMAAYVPNTRALYQDVTALYAGRFGVKSGERAKAFRIYLNPNATFDDPARTKITADSYLYSMKQQLDPLMMNRRADSYYGGDFAVYNAKNYLYQENGVTDFSQVGLLAGKDASSGLEYLDIVLENSLPTPDFYLPYYNTSTWLVHKDMYEKNKIYYYEDGTKTVGKRIEGKTLSTVGSQYCTSVATSVGYGPYKLTGFGLDSYLSLTRSEGWYGYHDGMHEGQYQADEIYFSVIEDHKTEMLSFLNGDLCEVALDSADMEIYGGSSRVEYTPQDYTTKLTINTDFKKLKERSGTAGVNKTILTVPDFRKGISLSVNRDEFSSAYTAAGSAGYGLLNTMYVFDPIKNKAYRSTEEGRQAICALYGIDYGIGQKYATLDEAYEAVTGYNLKSARAAMQSAYDYATTHNEKGETVEKGGKTALYDGRQNIRIDMVVYSADETYVQMFNYLNDCVKAACVGTDLEGKVGLTMKTDQDYYNSAYAGNVDMMFSTWGGSAFNGLSILSNVYCDNPTGGGNQMEYGFDTSKVQVTLPLDLTGELVYENYVGSLKDWADWLNNQPVVIKKESGNGTLGAAASVPIEVKSKIFAALEGEYLSHFVAIPLYYRNSAALRSEKVQAAASAYVDIVGFGGVRFMTFSYDDEAWKGKDQSSFDYTK